MNKNTLLGLLILALVSVAYAADEVAKRDANRNPTMIGVDSTSGEIRRVRTNASGQVEVTVAGAPLPPGAATEATLSSIDGKTPALGQTTMSGSQPVAIASDQSAVPISAASLPLPSGAATESTLNTLNGKMPSQGQATMAASVPVAIASDQSALPLDRSGSDTPSESFTNVTTAAQVMAASATRESSLICNEGPEPARCGSGSVTTTTGQRLLVDQCYTLDGHKPYRGALSCVSTTGPSTKISVAESN